MKPLTALLLLAYFVSIALTYHRPKRDVNSSGKSKNAGDDSDDDTDQRRKRTTTTATTTTTRATTPYPVAGIPCTEGVTCGRYLCCLQSSGNVSYTCQPKGIYHGDCDARVNWERRFVIPEVLDLLYCPCYPYSTCEPSPDPSALPNTGYCQALSYFG